MYGRKMRLSFVNHDFPLALREFFYENPIRRRIGLIKQLLYKACSLGSSQNIKDCNKITLKFLPLLKANKYFNRHWRVSRCCSKI
jgi:hypothetical protein